MSLVVPLGPNPCPAWGCGGGPSHISYPLFTVTPGVIVGGILIAVLVVVLTLIKIRARRRKQKDRTPDAI